MTTEFKTILDDLKTSAVLAKRNILSFLLATLGMALLVGVILLVFAMPFAILAVSAGPAAVQAWADSLVALAMANPIGTGVAFYVLLGLPIITLILIVVGSIYGISKEIVETGTTRAESAFSWFRRKFLSFAGAGFLLSLVIVTPAAAVAGAVSLAFNYTPPVWAQQVVSMFSFIWCFITVGLCMMVLPAVTHGKGVQESFKESFRLARTRFDRVFGLLTGIVVLLAISFGPAAIWGMWIGLTGVPPPMTLNPVSVFVMVWSAIAGLLWFVLFIPMSIVASCKVYAELTNAKVGYQQAPPELPMV
ncbi:MAG: hypothetical protein HXY34_01420 [Candidatus Thorarchaeota archaeon]|nr:hypothetical protein [Candidatus Thorarchaeota archaeon]